MSRLTTPSESELQAETLEALAAVRQQGRLAVIYLQFANSEAAVRVYLQMERALSEGSLLSREVEAIKLHVSQHTGCDYCLSVHTLKAGRSGLDAAQQQAVRAGLPLGEPRLDALLGLTGYLLRNPGRLPDELLAQARAAGLTDGNLVDLTLAMSTILFTNLTNHINDSRSTLPVAPELAVSAGKQPSTMVRGES